MQPFPQFLVSNSANIEHSNIAWMVCMKNVDCSRKMLRLPRVYII